MSDPAPARLPNAPPPERSAFQSLVLGPVLQRELVLDLPGPPSAARQALVDSTEPLLGPFTMVAKLSGGGIVIRVLRAPETEHPLFGRFDGDHFSVAPVHHGGDVTPFQPIVRGSFAAHGANTRLRATLAPHPHAQSYDVAFHVVGVLLLIGAAIQATVSLGLGALLATFGLLAVLFPRGRAAAGFALEARRVEATLRRVFDLPEEAS